MSKEGFKMKDIFSTIEQQIENIDEKIEGIVKNATDSKNYEKLNQQINNMINSSAGAFEKGIAQAEKLVNEQSEKFKSSYQLQQEKLKKHSEDFKKSATKNKLFAKKDGVYAGGVAMAIIGFVLASLLGIAGLVMLILYSVSAYGVFMGILRMILAPLFITFLIIGITGMLMKARFNRFKQYVQKLGGRMLIDVADLARSVGKSTNFVRRDLKKMIVANWFKEGQLTSDESALIVCKEAHEEYLIEKQSLLEEEQRVLKAQQAHEQLPEQARVIIRKGEDFLAEIHENKVAISEYEMTIKLSHLESILKKIFKRAELHPEIVPQMRRMMDYYIPTTIKLLDAYVQLDKQAVVGANITAAKEEIKGSLDTLISAYEKLLDDLFKDVMLDVSTDISVLNTMLAQDGLADDDFQNLNRQGAKEL